MKKGTGGLLPPEQQAKLVGYFIRKVKAMDLPDEDSAVLLHHLLWDYVFSRPQQCEPEEEHDGHFMLGGRGSGKTRGGAERLFRWASEIPNSSWAVVGPTLNAVKEVQFEGASGLNKLIPASSVWKGTFAAAYNSSKPALRLANGALLRGYSSEVPGRLRGPNFHGGWLDEPAEFADSDRLPEAEDTTFSNMVFSNRQEAPNWSNRIVLTGTPKPVRLLTGIPGPDGEPGLLTGYEGIVVSKMSTFDNSQNLSESFLRRMDKLKGKRIGRQEIEAELLTDVKGALWKQAWIVVGDPPPKEDFEFIVIGVDPSGGGDDIGIVVVGIYVNPETGDDQLWVLDDLTDSYTPAGWAREVERQFLYWEANKIAVERNYGADLVTSNLERETNISSFRIEEAWASRGKDVRAEPVAAIYEPRQNHWGEYIEAPGLRAMHAKNMPVLVDQMTTWKPGNRNSPNNLDALVWAATIATKARGGTIDFSEQFPGANSTGYSPSTGGRAY